MGIHEQIQLQFDALNDTEKEMVSYLEDHMEDMANLSIVEMARMLSSSRSSVLRLAQKLGYRGYSEMKFEISQAVTMKEVIPSNLVQQFEHDVQRSFELCSQVNFMPLLRAIEQSEKMVVYATGFVQNNYAKQLSSELFLYGKPNHLVSGEANFEIIARTLGPKDLVLVVGYSGNTPGIRNAINILNLRKVPICSVTVLSRNFLTDHARYSLFFETSPLPLAQINDAVSLNALAIPLSILSRKYLEYVLYDEV